MIVHVDAAVLVGDGSGCCELHDGPVISAETARRLGCDADVVARIELDGLQIGLGRARRTVTPALRRLLEARDGTTCCFPGCERTRHLQAHHLRPGRTAARRASTTSPSSATTTIGSSTRAATAPRATATAGCASATDPASSARTDRGDRRREASTSFSSSTPGSRSTSAPKPTATRPGTSFSSSSSPPCRHSTASSAPVRRRDRGRRVTDGASKPRTTAGRVRQPSNRAKRTARHQGGDRSTIRHAPQGSGDVGVCLLTAGASRRRPSRRNDAPSADDTVPFCGEAPSCPGACA